MLTLPNQNAPFTNTSGRIQRPWVQYLQQFTQAPPNWTDVIVSGSPFSYTAQEPGNISITGGTVTGVVLTRGANSINMGAGTSKFIPVAINDTVVITYSVLPTVKFIPSYGQNTTNN